MLRPWIVSVLIIVNSCRFKSSVSDEPRRMQVLDLYCLARFESEVQVEESQLKTTVAKEFWYLAYPYILRNMAVHEAMCKQQDCR